MTARQKWPRLDDPSVMVLLTLSGRTKEDLGSTPVGEPPRATGTSRFGLPGSSHNPPQSFRSGSARRVSEICAATFGMACIQLRMVSVEHWWCRTNLGGLARLGPD